MAVKKRNSLRADKDKNAIEYPSWVCFDCGKKHGRRIAKEATWHPGECDVCGKEATVTEPRDFGHLNNSWRDER